MKERPILMSPPMVQALLREVDPKTVTRRTKGLEVINQNPNDWQFEWAEPLRNVWTFTQKSTVNDRSLAERNFHQEQIKCPYGVSGDRLWVKETYFAFGRWESKVNLDKGRDDWQFLDWTQTQGHAYQYLDNPPKTVAAGRSTNWGWYKRSSLFMPRTASRLTFEITRIRAEQLQNITVADAIAEGIESFRPVPGDGEPATLYRNYETGRWTRNPVHSYQTLWEDINGPDAWDANPWVWAITFQRVADQQ